MFRVITKRHKHTRRRGTMRKKNPTIRRRHSSHLKHSRRNLHKSRSRRGGGGALGWAVKGVTKVKKGFDKAKRQAERERQLKQGEELRAQYLQSPPQTFQAPRGSEFMIIPAAYAASVAPARFSTAQGISSGEMEELISHAPTSSQRPFREFVPPAFLPTTFSSRVKSSSRRGSLTSNTNP